MAQKNGNGVLDIPRKPRYGTLRDCGGVHGASWCICEYALLSNGLIRSDWQALGVSSQLPLMTGCPSHP